MNAGFTVHYFNILGLSGELKVSVFERLRGKSLKTVFRKFTVEMRRN